MADNKILYYPERIVGDYRPITADIFLTNICNNNCPYCTYKRWEMDSGIYSMKAGEFISYVERLREMGVRGFILTGGGEPTMCEDFGKITRYLEKEGIHYGINTNFNKLEYIKPDYLKVSLDGWNEDSYKESRGVYGYERTRKNIQAYAWWKKTNSQDTALGIQRVVREPGEVYRFYAANRDLDVDCIVFRPIESTGGVAYLDEYAEHDIRETIEAVKDLEKMDSRVTLNYKWNLIGEREERCTAQWAQIAVNERGEVMYCCHKPYEIVGHVLDDDILEKKARAHTDMERCDIPCRMTAPNKVVAGLESQREKACFI